MRRHWYALFFIGLIFALLLSFVSVWSVWNPYLPGQSLHNGNYSGASAVSYPLWMNMHVATVSLYTPAGAEVVGNVSFSLFIADVKVFQTNGTLQYASFGLLLTHVWYHVNYELDAPFFSNAIAFFSFLLFLFTLFNISGFTLGMILCYIASRALKSKSIGHVP